MRKEGLSPPIFLCRTGTIPKEASSCLWIPPVTSNVLTSGTAFIISGMVDIIMNVCGMPETGAFR